MVLIWALAGAALGSFLNVVIDRLPAGQSLVRPPSHCPGCGRRLRPAELVPVLSYLVLRGRCRTCGAIIPLRVFIVELGAAILFGYLRWRYGATPQFLFLGVFLPLLTVLAFIDLEHRIIPNKLVYPAAALAFVTAPFYPDPSLSLLPQRALLTAAGGALAFGALLLPALVYPAGMGWGDVKMAGFVGLATGFPLAIVALFVTFIAGGVLAVLALLLRLRKWRDPIPYGPFIALGAALALLWGDPLWDAYLKLLTF